MGEMNQKLVEQWERLKTLFAMAEVDMLKNARGNYQAGVRVRKVLRELKNETQALVKLSTEESKKAKEEKTGA